MQNTLGFSAIGWVHYRLAGGIRQILIVAGIYAAFLVGAIMFAMRVSHPYGAAPWMFYQLAVNSIVGLQGFVLLVFGGFRVSTAIRLDFSSNMMESHRLMPLEGGYAVLGYILGATAQVWAVALVNVAVTLVVGTLGGIDVGHALAAHAVLIEFAIFFWILTALAGLTNRPFLRSVTGIPIILLVARELVSAVFPGLFMFCAPVLGRTLFFSGMDILTPALGWSLAGQAAAGGICFFAAARKYRQPDKPAIYPWQGALLLAVWVALTLIGSSEMEGIRWDRDLFDRFGDRGRLISTMALALLLMIVPLASAAWFADYFRKTRPKMPRGAIEARALGYVAITAALALLATRVFRHDDSFFKFPTQDINNLLILLMPLLGHALAIHFILRIIYRGGGRFGGLLVFAWIFCFVLLPLIADFLVHVALQERAPEMGVIGSVSPIGTAALVARKDHRDTLAFAMNAGALLQLAAGAGIAALYYITGRKRSTPQHPST